MEFGFKQCPVDRLQIPNFLIIRRLCAANNGLLRPFDAVRPTMFILAVVYRFRSCVPGLIFRRPRLGTKGFDNLRGAAATENGELRSLEKAAATITERTRGERERERESGGAWIDDEIAMRRRCLNGRSSRQRRP